MDNDRPEWQPMMLAPIAEGVRIIVLTQDFSSVDLYECDFHDEYEGELAWSLPSGEAQCPATMEYTMKLGAAFIRAPFETPRYKPYLKPKPLS